MKVSRCMSTQHPDNVTQPFFTENSVLSGEDEVQEAYYVFSHLNIEEQLWDSEGKEVDNHVVKNLLTKHEHFFRSKKLGRDVFLTLRLPNPAIEKNEAKILLETLESIPRAFDIAMQFYEEDIPPIFEVVLPMTRNSAELERLYLYYRDFVVGKQYQKVGDIKIKEWIGSFKPENIKVLPLVEDKESLTNIKKIVSGYLTKHKELEHQRVWLARSDPALNYGMLSAILLNKYALARLDEVQNETSVEIFPIIGVGSAPFRGNFRPDNINCLQGYPSAQTFTIQSAFKYDYPYLDVKSAIDKINSAKRGKCIFAGDEALSIIEKYSEEYNKQLRLVVPWVNKVSKYIPRRRKRKLHIGLFGYSRGLGEIKLPRAIGFCASLYSLGLPPELLALNSVTPKDAAYFEGGVYRNFHGDIKSALQYMNLDNIQKISEKLANAAEKAIDEYDVEINNEHREATDNVMKALSGNEAVITESLLKAAWLRRFLG